MVVIRQARACGSRCSPSRAAGNLPESTGSYVQSGCLAAWRSSIRATPSLMSTSSATGTGAADRDVWSTCAATSAGNRSSRLAGDHLLLRRQRTPRAVGHLRDPRAQLVDVVRRRPRRGSLPRAVRRCGARRACTACTARTTRPRGTATRPAATATRSSESSYTMKPPEPRPLPIAAKRFVAHGRVERGAGDERARDTGEHGADLTTGPGAAADRFDDLAQRRSHDDFADTTVDRRTRHRAHDRSRRFRRSLGAEPLRAARQDPRDVRERLDVVDQRGRRLGVGIGSGHLDVRRQAAVGADVGGRLDDLAHAAPVRRRDARERIPAVDRLQQRGLFAVEILVRAIEDRDLDPVDPARAR